MDLAPSPKNRTDVGAANRRYFLGFPEDNSTQWLAESRRAKFRPVLVIGAFAEFRPVGRNFDESRPLTSEPAGRRAREQPSFPLMISL